MAPRTCCGCGKQPGGTCPLCCSDVDANTRVYFNLDLSGGSAPYICSESPNPYAYKKSSYPLRGVPSDPGTQCTTDCSYCYLWNNVPQVLQPLSNDGFYDPQFRTTCTLTGIPLLLLNGQRGCSFSRSYSYPYYCCVTRSGSPFVFNEFFIAQTAVRVSLRKAAGEPNCRYFMEMRGLVVPLGGIGVCNDNKTWSAAYYGPEIVDLTCKGTFSLALAAACGNYCDPMPSTINITVG